MRDIVAKIHDEKPHKQLSEKEITKQQEVIKALIEAGLWPSPGGAWCSAGVPVFDKMSDCGGYPVFKHFDFKGEDVTNFANLDCQTPYYFVTLEDGKFNEPVIKFFIEQMQKLQRDYNFDGFRVDHIDHVVDTISEQKGVPISYRAPREVLARLNSAMKEITTHFASLAEYMLWGGKCFDPSSKEEVSCQDGFLYQYHEDMKFDILWGNDIVSQSEKNPEKIVEDNQNLSNYNTQNFKIADLSILKTYNNQDGEFGVINQYPGQLGEEGALFKWFKYKFLPGGKYAQRPCFYIDGDESFTKKGIEEAIGNEVSMKREKNYKFFEKFDAINRFAKSQELVTEGEAQIILQEDDGFVTWMVSKEPLKSALLVVANYLPPTEQITTQDDKGGAYTETIKGHLVEDKTVHLPGDYTVKAEYIYETGSHGGDFVEKPLAEKQNSLHFEKLKPSEFRIYLLSK